MSNTSKERPTKKDRTRSHSQQNLALIARLRELHRMGYGLALLEAGERTLSIDRLLTQGVPVLEEAEGPLGVIRAMHTRCGDLLTSMAGAGIFTLSYAREVDRVGLVRWWTIRVTASTHMKV